MKAYSCTGNNFVALLKDCIRLKDLQRGRDIHLAISRNNLLQKNPFVCSLLVDMYAKCGSISEAQEVFEALAFHDVVMWTALISGHAKSENGGCKALSCFKRMQLEGVCPNAFTFSCILKACESIKETDRGKEIHATISFCRVLQNNLFVASALVDMYAKCGNFVEAEEVFSGLPSRDVVVWTALISGYLDQKHGMEALKCFEQMLQNRVSPSAVTFACVLKACAIVGDAKKGKETHCEIVKRNLLRRDLVLGNSLIDMYAKCGLLAEAKGVFDHVEIRDVVSWTALIAGYADHEFGEEACDCYTKMQVDGVSPDAYAYSCCLKACSNIGAAGRGEEVHADIRRTGFGTEELIIGTALVDMYAKCGLLDKAHMVFDKLPSRDEVSWNSLLTGYSQHGDVENGLCIFERMRGDGYEPHPVTFISLINACSHAGLVEKGQVCFEVMSNEFSITPVLEHHTCMVDLYSRAGQLDEAVVMLNSSPCQPNMVMLLTIIGACRKLGDLEVGMQTFHQALGLDKRQSAAYVGMFNLYAEGGAQEDISYKELFL